MRKMVDRQMLLVQRWIESPRAHEYEEMSKVLDEAPEAVQAVYDCLVRAGGNPKLGRHTLTAEQVMRIVIVKQLEGLSYEKLEFALADSATFRTFCRLGHGCNPSVSGLNRNIKPLDPGCLEKVHRCVLDVGLDDGMETGDRMRADCTTTETNIHDPTDSTLLWDCCRVLTRLTHRARELGELRLTFVDHTRKAKRRALAILNAKNQEQRYPLYKELLALAEEAISDVLRMGAALVELTPTDMRPTEGLVEKIDHYVALARQVGDQAYRRVVLGEAVPAREKIVSIFEPHTDIIIKDRRETIFGHKLCLSEGGSGLILDIVIEDGNPADSTLAVRMVQRAHEITSKVFKKVAFDGGFASRENLAAIKAQGVKQVMFSKSRGIPVEQMVKNQRSYRKLRNFRAGIEGTISWAKRCFGLRRCNWQGLASFKSYVLASVVSANLLVIARKRIEVATNAMRAARAA